MSNAEIFIGGYTTTNIVAIDTIFFTDTNYNGSLLYSSGLLTKFDSLGRIYWVKFLGSPSSAIYGVDADASGNIYCTGFSDGTCFFDTLTIFAWGGFIVKCDSAGNIILLNKLASTGIAFPNDIQTDKSGNCYATGHSIGNVTFGGSSFTNNGVFLAKYLPDGAVVWAKQIKGDGDGNALAVNSDGSVIDVAGDFSDFISIDSLITIYNSGSNNYVSGDVFLAKYDGLSGIEDKIPSIINSLQINPNPTFGTCSIIIPGEFTHENFLMMLLYYQIGNIVLQKKIGVSDHKIILNLQNFSKGFYMVSLSNGQKCYFGKIILQ